MKKIIMLVLAVFVFISVVGCSNNEEKNIDKKIENTKEMTDAQKKDAERKSRESRFEPSENKKIEF